MAEEFYSIGKGEIRQDALLKVTGQAEYTTDIHPRGMVYGKILGSPAPPPSSMSPTATTRTAPSPPAAARPL